MKAIHSMIAALRLAFVLPAAAGAATTDPEVIIYRFPGVADNGGTNSGIATVFHCTNFSGVQESLRIVVRATDGTLVGNFSQPINHLQTLTLATHATAIYFETVVSMGPILQGSAAIAATSVNVVCTAMTLDASTFSPVGFPLHGIRFNPIPGSQE